MQDSAHANCGCFHGKRSSVFVSVLRTLTIVAFALVGVVALTPTASAFDNLSQATSTVPTLLLNDNGANRLLVTKYLATTTEIFDKVDIVFFRGSTATAIDVTMQVFLATTTTFGTSDSYGPGTFIGQSATTSLSAIPQGQTGTTTFTLATPITMTAGQAYLFKWQVSARFGTTNTSYSGRAPSGIGRFMTGILQDGWFAGNGFGGEAPAMRTRIAPPPTGETRIIEIVSPTGVVASTTVDFDIDYFFNDSNFESVDSAEVCVEVQSLELISYTSPTLAAFSGCEDVIASGEGNLATTTVLGRGLFQGYATIYVNGEVYEAKPFRFVVVNSTLPEALPIIAGIATTTGQGGFGTVCATEQPDNIFGWIVGMGCFILDGINGIISFLFLPSPEIVQQYTQISLRNRAPFEYVYQVGDVWDVLYTSTSTGELSIVASTTIGTITLLDDSMIEAWQPIPDLFKLILSYLLYFFTAMYIYRKVLRIHDKTT